MSIGSKLIELKNELPLAVKLVAVSKFKPVDAILEAYEAGQRAFGESRPQELVTKASSLPKDIEWHFIGHLQTNKINSILPFVSLIQSVDSEHLLDAIERCAGLQQRTVDCLLEIHIAREESKQGLSFDEARLIMSQREKYKHIRIKGVMGMATQTDDWNQVRMEFKSLKSFAESVCDDRFDTISMGMSDDFQIAVEEGTTIVRIGTYIFGNRV